MLDYEIIRLKAHPGLYEKYQEYRQFLINASEPKRIPVNYWVARIMAAFLIWNDLYVDLKRTTPVAVTPKEKGLPAPYVFNDPIDIAWNTYQYMMKYNKIDELKELDSLRDFILKYYIQGKDGYIKRCSHCGRLFHTMSKSALYCNYPMTATKPCYMIHRSVRGSDRSGDKAFKVYSRKYRTLHARIRAGHMTKERLDLWRKDAKDKMNRVRNGTMALEEFEQWLSIW